MPRSVLKELLEVRDEILGVTHPDEPLLHRLKHGYMQTVDVVGAFISATDDENKEADMSQLISDLSTFARSTADSLLADRPFLLGAVQTGLTAAVSGARNAISKHTENLDEWVKEYVLPPLHEAHKLLDHTIVQLEGDTHDEHDGHDHDDEDE